MGTGKQYDEEFKKQAIKLAKEIGIKAAADELCIPKGTHGTWVQKARIGEIDMNRMKVEKIRQVFSHSVEITALKCLRNGD